MPADARADPGLDEQTIAEARSWIGRTLRIRLNNTEASRDNIRKYAFGIGDMNPLWSDPDYGPRSVHGTTVAPPTFLLSIYHAITTPGLPELHAVCAGAEWRFHDWVRLGDRLDAEARSIGADVKVGTRGGRRLLQTGLVRYYRCNEPCERTCVAELRQSYLRMPAARGSRDGLDVPPRAPATYTEDEMDRLCAEALAVGIRGAEPRHWDDTAERESIGTVLKGPYSAGDQIAYYVGEGGKGRRAHQGFWLDYWRAKHRPEDLYDDHEFSRQHLGHFDAAVAHRLGMPGAYDDGNQRAGTIASLVTSWMGDAGFLTAFSVRHRAPVVVGDVVRIAGAVKDRRPIDGDPEHGEVTIELVAHNQLGDLVSTGLAVVRLPRRRER
jgi:acyl dehydratase